MIVVADTSPISYAVLLGRQELLAELFGSVHIPTAVQTELASATAPASIRVWVAARPSWLVVEADYESAEREADPKLERLHAGERAAILLAETLRADLLLMDEKAGRSAASERGLKVAGLLAVLRIAAERGRIDFAEAIADLRRLGFRMSPSLLKRLG